MTHRLSLNLPSLSRQTTTMTNVRRWPLYAGVAVGIWLGLFLYVGSLSLPFFQDDVAHIRWLAGIKSPLAPFLTAAGIPAYRPLGEMFLKIWYLVLGRHDPVWLRFLNISMHNINVALVAVLAVRLDRGPWRAVTGGLAAVFFAVLPFAYQAVPWINVFFYPLNNLLQLLMVLLYWQGRVKGSNRLLVAAFILCFLSPFEIEYGLMNAGLLMAVEIVLWLQGRQKALWLGGPLLALVLNIVFLVIWLVVPKSAYEFGPPTAERMMQITVYLLQGLTYPVSPLALPLMERSGMSDLLAITIVAVPALFLAIGLLAYRRKWPILVISLLWFGLINLPGLITLTFDYFINGPRLLYPAGPAMAWLWAGFFAALLETKSRRELRPVLVGLAAVAVLVVVGLNLDFVRTRMEHYHIVENAVHELGEAARDAPPGESLLVVNMPSWLTPLKRTFALGNNGVQIMPFYVSIEDFVYAANDRDYPTTAVQFHNVRQPQPYYYGLHGHKVGWEELHSELSKAGEVYLTHFTPERIDLEPAGHVATRSRQAGPPDRVTFDQRIELSLDSSKVDEDSVSIDLLWFFSQKIDGDLTVFVHLYGPDGQLVAQDDGYPLRGLAPFWLWDQGQALLDRRTLPWPDGAPVGPYRLAVGLYDPADGQRLEAFDLAGNRFEDDAAVLLTFDRPFQPDDSP